jgi:hypothetical protein
VGTTAARRVCALAVGTVAFLPLGMIPVQASGTRGWHLTDAIGAGAQNIDPAFPGGLAAPSRDTAWSIWSECIWPCSSGSRNVVRHWNGRRWAVIPESQLHGVSAGWVTAKSATEAWLFGVGRIIGQSRDTALHWNGLSWRKQTTPPWVIRINGSGNADISMADFGPRNVWVFSLGGYLGEKTAFAAHYHAGRWTKSYLPRIPESVAAVSSTNIWVIGSPLSGKGSPDFMRWNGRRWATSAFPRQRMPGYPFGFFATGSGDLWVGWAPTAPKAAAYLLHKTRHGWVRVKLPPGDTVTFGAAGDGRGGIWLDGFAPGPKRVQLFLHWRQGRWTTYRVPEAGWSPGNVDELALIPGTRSVWAIGNVYGPGGNTVLNRGAIWRYFP